VGVRVGDGDDSGFGCDLEGLAARGSEDEEEEDGGSASGGSLVVLMVFGGRVEKGSRWR
jgi:hypothetical protein